MPKIRSLVKQIQDVLDAKLKIGHSKYADKLNNDTAGHIYSWSTYRSYLKHGSYFAKWAKAAHGCKTLEAAKPFVNEYLQMRIDNKLSPYTQKLDANAIAKIYGCSSTDFITTQDRHRAAIKRSRGVKARDKHFSEKRNQEFVDFCRATGLRRSEIASLKKNQLVFDAQTNSYFLKVIGKGGRHRLAPVLSDEAVQRIKDAKKFVWDKIPNGADIHAYRADYCTAIYNQHARPLDKTPKKDLYRCKKDLKGVIYDKNAMITASQALGHNRLSIIAAHYIRK
jgi:integrase